MIFLADLFNDLCVAQSVSGPSTSTLPFFLNKRFLLGTELPRLQTTFPSLPEAGQALDSGVAKESEVEGCCWQSVTKTPLPKTPGVCLSSFSFPFSSFLWKRWLELGPRGGTLERQSAKKLPTTSVELLSHYGEWWLSHSQTRS